MKKNTKMLGIYLFLLVWTMYTLAIDKSVNEKWGVEE